MFGYEMGTLEWVIILVIVAVLFWKWQLKGLVKGVRADMRFRKRVKALRELGLEVPEHMINPEPTDWETEKLNDMENLPTDEEILLYYKMYCKKFELDNQDTWTTLEPMPFEEWEKHAKSKTEVHKFKDSDFGFWKGGGYQFIIPHTMDTMIGFPPNHSYHRYHDYKGMVEVDELF